MQKSEFKKKIPRGAKKAAFFDELDRCFPAGQFKFGEARECYQIGEMHLGVEHNLTNSMNVRDRLMQAGAHFAEHTRLGGHWPRTSFGNRVTLPCHPDHARLLLEDKRDRALQALEWATGSYRNTVQFDLEEAQRELARLPSSTLPTSR